jgi:2,4'-dihydroxyacetophenone dioxygenase
MTAVDVPTAVRTGPVYAYTTSGSFLYEPAGSVHTLQVLEDDTHVWFQIYGPNLNLDADGNIESAIDGALTLAAYYMLCEAEGLPRPNVLVG